MPRKSSKFINIKGEIDKGQSLYGLLKRYNVSHNNIIDMMSKLNAFLRPDEIKPGDRYYIKIDSMGEVETFEYMAESGIPIHLKRDKGGFRLLRGSGGHGDNLGVIRGRIKKSLYQAMMEHIDNDRLVNEFTSLFRYMIDLKHNIKKGDEFSLVVEKKTKKRISTYGKILAAEYMSGSSLYQAFYYPLPGAGWNYYSFDGSSMKRPFLASPISYNGILYYYYDYDPHIKHHEQPFTINYTVPRGTKVQAIGDGEVIFIGWLDDIGQTIKIRHPDNYISAYGHLQKITGGLRKGARVKQGRVIGYVGKSGRGIIPHLHFTIQKNGKRIGFYSLNNLPAKENIPGEYMNDFIRRRERMLKLLHG